MCAQSLRHVQLFATPWTVPGGACGKEPTYQCRRLGICGFSPWVGRISWRRKWQPTPASLPGKFHSQRSLAGYNLYVHDRLLQSCLTLCDTMDLSPPGYSVHRMLKARILEWVAMPSSKGFPNPGIEPRSLALQVDSLPSEPPGKTTNPGVGS